MKATVANPSIPGGRRQVQVTDRAQRYRANAAPPPGPRQCHYCGSRKNVEVDHVDGHEEHGQPENLTWACRSCNTRKGAAFRNAGRGRRTRQFNPALTGALSQIALAATRNPRRNPAKTLGQWLTAVTSLKGNGPMDLAAAIAMVHSTPHAKRSEFAREIWATRRQHGTDRQEVPF